MFYFITLCTCNLKHVGPHITLERSPCMIRTTIITPEILEICIAHYILIILVDINAPACFDEEMQIINHITVNER